MSKEPISAFLVPDMGDLPADVRARILAVQEKAGFVPNVFLALSHRPDEFRAFFAYHDALMLRAGGLSKAEREMIVVATSSVNHCLYCVVAHGALLRIYAKDAEIADRLAVNPGKAALSQRHSAMIAFAMKVATRSHEIVLHDHEMLRDVGFDHEDIWDIGAIAGFFAMSNRLANMSFMQPNAEFFTMGRLSKLAD
jgi:uncharacterized peroxidase-related enzyme